VTLTEMALSETALSERARGGAAHHLLHTGGGEGGVYQTPVLELVEVGDGELEGWGDIS
jgi:hypothetical protein